MSTLHEASRDGHIERVKQLLDGGDATVDVKHENGRTSLMLASEYGHTDVVRLLLDRGAPVDEREPIGKNALWYACQKGHAEVVKQLLDGSELIDGGEQLLDAEVVQLLNDTFAKRLLEKGVSLVDLKDIRDKVLSTVVAFDEDQLGRMAAAQVRRGDGRVDGPGADGPGADESKREEQKAPSAQRTAKAFANATGTAVLQLVSLAGFARDRARKLRSSDPRLADDHQVLFARLQLAAAACIKNGEFGKDRDEKGVQKLFDSHDGGKALDHAVQIEAKELLLAQPVV